jgi:hypothetical protein
MQLNSNHRYSYIDYLYQVLMDFGNVSLSGLGTFILDTSPAHFNKSLTEIFPPKTVLNFVRDPYCTSDFASKLQRKGIDGTLASNFENEVLHKIKSEDEIPLLPGVKKVRDEVVIENQERFDRFLGLLPVNTKVLPYDAPRHYVHEHKMAHEPQLSKSLSSYQSRWTEFIVPAIIGLAVLLGSILWYQTYKLNSRGSNYNQKVYIAPKPERVKESVTSEIIHGRVDSILESNEALGGTQFKRENEVVKKSKENKASTMTSWKDTETVTQPIVPTPETKANDLIPQNNVCVIIVGAFKEVSNAEKLIQKLKQSGYETYTKEVNGLNRVGIRFDCQKQDVDSFKQIVQNNIAKDAWKLQDTL